MSLFNILSAPYRRREAIFDKEEIEACLSDDDEDHFFATVTAYYKEQDISATYGVIVQEITAAFADNVQVSDRILMDECCRVVRENMKVLCFDVKKIERL